MIIFTAIANSDIAKRHLGSGPVRFFPFGSAPQGVEKTYATYQLVGGSPMNTLTIPDADRMSYQIDVFSTDASKCVEAANAMRDVLQLHGYITGYNVNAREPETRLWRVSFDIDFITNR